MSNYTPLKTTILPLENGDRLTRPEFEPRYQARPNPQKVELIEGSPELIVEIAASSATNDLYDKKRSDQQNGVQEYLVWQVYERQICWCKLQEGEYIPVETDEKGMIKSQVFPGLWLEVRSLLEENLAQVLKRLQEGIESVETQEFIRRSC